VSFLPSSEISMKAVGLLPTNYCGISYQHEIKGNRVTFLLQIHAWPKSFMLTKTVTHRHREGKKVCLIEERGDLEVEQPIMSSFLGEVEMVIVLYRQKDLG
jgi:hypothetical protein